MIPVKLQLANFMSYRRPESLDFTGFDLAILNGENGAGKSTLLEAITWALWGQSRAGSDDDLIHQGESSMWVEFLFDYEKNRYRVVRTRDRKGRGTTTLEFQVAEDHGSKQGILDGKFAKSWKTLTGATIKQTQDAIIDTLKLDYDLFVNSSYLRQGHADEFTVKMPAERKEILADILDLSLYDMLEEKAKEVRRQLEAEEQLLTSQVTDLSERIGGKARVEEELAETLRRKATIEDALDRVEKDLKKYEEDRRKFASLSREIEFLRTRYEELSDELRNLGEEKEREEEQIKEAMRVLEKKTAIEKEYAKLLKLRKENEFSHQHAQAVAKVNQELSVLDHRKQELKATIERLRQVTVCPTCLRVMTKKEAQLIIGRLTKAFQREVHPARTALMKKLEKIGYDEKKHEEIRKSLDELEGVEQEKRQLDVAEVTVKKAKEVIASIDKRIDQAKAALIKVATDGKRIKKEFEEVKTKQSAWEELEQKLGPLRADHTAVTDIVGGLKKSMEQIRDFEQQVRDKTQKLKEIGEKKGIFADLAFSFGKKGVQAMIIEQTIPMIEEEANELLSKITGGRMQTHFVTQREKKTGEGELIETLDIEIGDELGIRPYEQYSGGEAFRINFAIRVAMAKLLAVRAGAKLRFLVIDEGFGALDVSGREDIVAAIDGVRDAFDKIIVITHIEEFKNLFPTRIEITKDSSGSHIQVFSQ